MIAARRALLVLFGFTAVCAVLAGLARLGFVIPFAARQAPAHGPLMVLGVFLGVIALERAVALGQGWGYLAPALAVAGAAADLAGFSGVSGWLSVAGTLGLVLVNVAIVRRQSATHTWLMLLGAVVLAAGATAWAGGAAIASVVPAWMAFFMLTIVAERLELSRLVRTPRWATAVLVAISLVLAGASVAALAAPGGATRAFGIALFGAGAWVATFDAARRTVRQPGLPRFAASGVLAGAAWLLVAGVDLALGGLVPAGPRYDAVLHAVFIGFVLSLVFAHTPIILPAVARVRVVFRRWLYVPLGLLHVTLVLRLLGDFLGSGPLRQAGGLGNAVSLALFAIAVAAARRAPVPGSDTDHRTARSGALRGWEVGPVRPATAPARSCATSGLARAARKTQ